MHNRKISRPPRAIDAYDRAHGIDACDECDRPTGRRDGRLVLCHDCHSDAIATLHAYRVIGRWSRTLTGLDAETLRQVAS